MGIKFDHVVVWLIVGGLAAVFLGKLPSRREKNWQARLKNLGLGLAGALLGGVLFTVFEIFGINLRFGEIAIRLQDLVAAILGALILLFSVRLYRWYLDHQNRGTSANAASASQPPSSKSENSS